MAQKRAERGSGLDKLAERGSPTGRGAASCRRRILRALAYLLAWLVVAVPAWGVLFTHSSAETVLASHDAVVHPTLDGWVRLDMGPYVPDLRTPSGGRIGVLVEMRKTTANSAPELAQRYAAIAAHPEAEQHRVTDEVAGLARDAALRAAAVGLASDRAVAAVGRRRRHELWRRVRRPDWRGEVRTGVTAVVLIGTVVLLVTQPWRPDPERVQGDVWLPVQDAIPDVTVPDDLRTWQIQGGLVTKGTRRLLRSLFDTYDRSKVFYDGVIERVPRDRRPAAQAGRRRDASRCWSATGTTTSAWTRSCARWPTRPVPRSSSTPATTPPRARPGRSSASTPSTPLSRSTTSASSSRATTTTAPS